VKDIFACALHSMMFPVSCRASCILLKFCPLLNGVLELLETSQMTEQQAALRVLKTVVPCSVRSKPRDKTSFRYCVYWDKKVWDHISVSIVYYTFQAYVCGWRHSQLWCCEFCDGKIKWLVISSAVRNFQGHNLCKTYQEFVLRFN